MKYATPVPNLDHSRVSVARADLCGHTAEDHSAFATAVRRAQQHPERANAHLDIPVYTCQHAYGDLHVAAVGKGLQLGHGGLLRRGESVGIHACGAGRASEQFEASICRTVKSVLSEFVQAGQRRPMKCRESVSARPARWD